MKEKMYKKIKLEDLEEGEEICPLCDSWSTITMCPICNTVGKIDWVDKIKKSKIIERAKKVRNAFKHKRI